MHYRSTYGQAPNRLAVLDIETVAPAAPDGGFPPWPTHKPIVASVLTADQANYGEWRFGLTSIGFDDERAAIERIDGLLEGRRTVTYNGKGFDLPVLAMTAMRAAAFECRNLTDAWASHRFSGSHIDVADVIGGFGSAPRVSLERLCEAIGIPVKTNGCGADVAELLRVSGRRAVERYCEEDVASTMLLFALVQGLRSNDAAYAASLIGDFAAWVQDAGLDHLGAFQAMSGDAVLERVRLLHRLDEGIRALDARVTESYFEDQRRLSSGTAPITTF